MRSIMLLLVALAPVTIGCHRAGSGPVVVVTASYPGANAETVADIVAAPIEQQVNGVEWMERLESESRNDGSYIARVWFKSSADPAQVATLVQNRVALAKPMLPEAVQRIGVALETSVAQQRENRATIALVDRSGTGGDALRRFSETVLKRLSADGVIVKPEVFPGPDENRVTVQIDRAKCLECGVSVSEISKAVEAANPGRKIDALKALRIPTAKGDAIPLGTLAALKLVDGPAGLYRLDLYPAIRISGSPPAGENAASAASRCAQLADTVRKSQNDAAGIAVRNLTAQ